VVEHQDVAVHDGLHRLLPVHLPGEGLEHHVHEHVAVDQAHGDAVPDDGDGLQIGIGLEELLHFPVGGVRGQGGHLDHEPGRRGAPVPDPAGAVGVPAPEQAGGRRGVGQGRGPAQEVALAEVQAQVPHHGEVRLQLDALAHDLGARLGGDVAQGLQELELDRVPAHALDEVHVDLHELRAQLRPQAKAGETLPQVVQGDGEAQLPEQGDGLHQDAEVVDGQGLGELDDDPARGHPQLLQPLDGQEGALGRRGQAAGAHVQEQLLGGPTGRVGPDQGPAAGALQVVELVGEAGHLEQAGGGVEERVRGTPDQALEGQHGPGLQVHDGLEVGLEAVFREDGPELVAQTDHPVRGAGRMTAGARMEGQSGPAGGQGEGGEGDHASSFTPRRPGRGAAVELGC